MNKLFIITTLTTLPACNNISDTNDAFIQINTVDINNQPIQAETVRWWFIDQIDTKDNLQCEQDDCSKWYIREKIASPVTISASASQIKDDPECSDIFEGEETLNDDQKEITLKLIYTATVCK